jgi:hypothetical protein
VPNPENAFKSAFAYIGSATYNLCESVTATTNCDVYNYPRRLEKIKKPLQR